MAQPDEPRGDAPGRRPSKGRAQQPTPPAAFISWAHTHRSWAPRHTAEWRQTVLDFATALRQIGGVDADLDLWHTASHENWSTYGVTAIRDSDFTLIAVSSAYSERWEETGSLSEGAGAAREANAIKSIFERDRGEFRRRVKVILLPDATIDDIPMELLASTERFRITSFDLQGLTPLLRSLHGKPEVPKPALGAVPALPPTYIADVSAESDDLAMDRKEPRVGGFQNLGADEDALQRRLSGIETALAEPANGLGTSAPAYVREALLQERTVLEATLTALEHVKEAALREPTVVAEPGLAADELAEAVSDAKDAIREAHQAMWVLPPIAREALFQYFHNGQPLTVGGTLDRFAVEDAVVNEELGYLNWVEDAEQTVSARRDHPRVGAADAALQRVRSFAFGGVSWEARAQAAPWARVLLHDEYGIDDPVFELRPVWVKLGFTDD